MEITSKEIARPIIKAVNRHLKKTHAFEGGRSFGIDFPTWNCCYPQMAKIFNQAAGILVGKSGNYLPKF